MTRTLSLRALAGAILCLTLVSLSHGQEAVPTSTPVEADPPLYYETVDDVVDPEADDEDLAYINADLNAPAPSSPEAKAAADAKKKAAAAKKKQAALKKAVNGAYAGVFYNNKFDYLCDPAYDDWHLGEDLKRMCVGDCMILDIGGQYRARYHLERGIRNATPTSLGLTGLNDDFLLHRTRLYANLEASDRVRVFVEGIYAESNFNQRAPRTIEVNRGDLLNAFVDVKLLDCLGCDSDGSLTARVGRQEMLYGSQRLVSPLDWANTRRNFDGFDLLYRDKDWAIDGFMTRPVIVNGNDFDSSDDSQGFHGLFATYKGVTDQTFDAYYYYYNNENLPAIAGNNGIHFNTTGGRWTGTKCDWLWDFEGGYQFGNNDDASGHSAMFAVAGVGRNIDHCWKPKVWLFYDYSTGGPDQGQRQGFDHLFPLGHKYHGFMDLYARSNIESPNLLIEAQPHCDWKVMFWYHYFMLENGGDTPYNVNMAPFNQANRPASNDLGHEIDLTATYIISPRADLLFGYSHFFAGQYYKQTPGVPFRGDADFFYTQFQVNF